MTDGLRKSHLRKAPQVGLSEVGLPDIYRSSSPPQVMIIRMNQDLASTFLPLLVFYVFVVVGVEFVDSVVRS